MKNQLLAVVLTSFCVSLFGQPVPFAWPTARVSILVTNESGYPLADVAVRAVFCATNDRSVVVPAEGFTDTSGLFNAEGHCDGTIGTRVTKPGYYVAGARVPEFRDAKDGRWLPWDQTVGVVLRRIEKPVPTYAKRTWVQLPQVGLPCGYDLMEGDWVSPWGKGKVSDFIFTIQNAYTNHNNFHVIMSLACSNQHDGIQSAELPREFAASQFKWPRTAPGGGYSAAYETQFGRPKFGFRILGALDKRLTSEDIQKQKFYFRIRTLERDGKIVSAIYGKLAEGFQLAIESPTMCKIRLSYYLNPAPLDRNMEFDLKQNLLKNIGQFEAPRDP